MQFTCEFSLFFEALLRGWSTWVMIEKASKTPYPPTFFSWVVLGVGFSLGCWVVLCVVSVRVCMLKFDKLDRFLLVLKRGFFWVDEVYVRLSSFV
jgi:hypothetical protein